MPTPLLPEPCLPAPQAKLCCELCPWASEGVGSRARTGVFLASVGWPWPGRLQEAEVGAPALGAAAPQGGRWAG